MINNILSPFMVFGSKIILECMITGKRVMMHVLFPAAFVV